MNNVEGVSVRGSSGSIETGTSGLEFIIAVASAMNVVRTSCVILDGPSCSIIESKIFRVMPIILSHTPPMWEAWGGLKIHEHPCSARNLMTFVSSKLEGMSSSLHAPMKFVP